MEREVVTSSIGGSKVNTAGHSRRGNQGRNGHGRRNPEDRLFVERSFVVKLSTTFALVSVRCSVVSDKNKSSVEDKGRSEKRKGNNNFA
jgi:hypothetical protein